MSENFEYLDTAIDAWIIQCINDDCEDISKLSDLEYFFFPFIKEYLENQKQHHIPLLFEYFLSRILTSRKFWERIGIINLKISQFANIYSGVIGKTVSIYQKEALSLNDNDTQQTVDYFKTKSFSTKIGEISSTDYSMPEESTQSELITTSPDSSTFFVHELQPAEGQSELVLNLTSMENILHFDSFFTPNSIELILTALGNGIISFDNIDVSYWRTEFDDILEDFDNKNLKFSIRKLLLYEKYVENQKKRLNKLK